MPEFSSAQQHEINESRRLSDKKIIREQKGEYDSNGQLIVDHRLKVDARGERESSLDLQEKLNSPEFAGDYEQIIDFIQEHENDIRQAHYLYENIRLAQAKLEVAMRQRFSFPVEDSPGVKSEDGDDAVNQALENLQRQLEMASTYENGDPQPKAQFTTMYKQIARQVENRISDFAEKYELGIGEIDFSRDFGRGHLDSPANGLRAMLQDAVDAKRYQLEMQTGNFTKSNKTFRSVEAPVSEVEEAPVSEPKAKAATAS
jgi:hypothetical protein